MAAPPASGRLDSWKEIADYLHRDVSTVMRWARRRGLPVHRVPGGRRHAVFAILQEINAWLESGGTGDSASKVRDLWSGTEYQTKSFEGKTKGGTAKRIDGLEPESAFGSSPRSSRRRSPGLLVVGATAVVAVASIVGVLAWGVRKPRRVSSVTFSGRQVLGWNSDRMIWSYDFGQPLRSLQPHSVDRKYLIVDRNGDGGEEVIVAAPLLQFESGDPSTDGVYCLSSTGKLLWRRLFTDRVHFGGEDCGPRWEVQALVVTGSGANSYIWCTICSYPTSVSMVVKIDPSGNATTYFVNYGHLGLLQELRVTGGLYLLAGGINNEGDNGTLAVLDETRPSGHAPQTGALSKCEPCPQGQPFRYFLFPRSEVIRVTGPPYNGVMGIVVTNGQTQVRTVEGTGYGTEAIWAMYDFSEALVPKSVFFSDYYWFAHEKLSTEGKIKHPLAACPERLKPIAVREWSSQEGWKDIMFPPVASRLPD